MAQTPPAVGDPFGYAFINETTGLTEQHNLFRSADGHIHALWFNFDKGWHHEDRTTVVHGVPRAVGDPFGYAFINEKTGLTEQHNLFRSADGHIHALWFDFDKGWHHEDRTTVVQGVPPAVGDPFGYAFINEKTGLTEQHNLFRSADGHIHALWFNFDKGWHHEDRTTLLQGVPPAVGDPFGYAFINETTGLTEQHNLFRSADGHIHALWFNFDKGWHHEDRTTLLQGVPPAVGDPFGYAFINEKTGLTEQHNLFRSADGHIHALWFNFDKGWHHDDRTTVVPVNTGRMCEYLDAPGTPQIGIRSYLLKGPHRALPMTWSLVGTVNGVTPAQMQSSITKAFALWTKAVPALVFNPLPSGGDISIGVGDLGAPNPATGNGILGLTQPDGSAITFNNNIGVSFVPALPGGNSLLGVAAHEIGHAIGILHSTTPGTLMFPFSSVTETLANLDIAAVRALYGWTPQREVRGIGTDSSPALCVCGPWLVMAWKGIGDDDRIWLSRTTDGENWLPQRSVPGTGTTDGPTLAWDGATLWLAIRGVPGDDALYWATSGDLGDNWSAVTQIPGTGSVCAPSLTVVGGVPLLVWRGISGDDALYYTTWRNPWAAQQQIGGTGSEDRPSVCVGFDNVPRMVWRGVPGDDSLYTSTLVGQFWQPQQQLSWVIAGNGPQGTVGIGVPGSSVGPTITNAGGSVFLAWQGVPGDDGIYFTQAAAGPGGVPPIEWSGQAVVEGIGTSHRPAIVMFMGLPFMAWKGVHDDHAIYTTRQVRT